MLLLAPAPTGECDTECGQSERERAIAIRPIGETTATAAVVAIIRGGRSRTGGRAAATRASRATLSARAARASGRNRSASAARSASA